MDDQEWLTAEEAAALAGVSLRTLNRWVAAGKIRKSSQRVPGRRDETLYSAEDVKREAPPQAEHPLPAIRSFALPVSSVPIHLKLFLTLEEAVQYTGLPAADLVRLEQAGRITPYESTEGPRFSRLGLDALTSLRL